MRYKDFYGNVHDVTEEYLVDLLKKIYNNEVDYSYIAGSLLCKYEGINHIFNVSPDILTKKNYWTAKIYLKNKSPEYVFWEDSIKIIKFCEERKVI